MDKQLIDQVTIVTGASRGIGRATALRFAEHGARLILNSTTSAGAEQTAAEVRALGGSATAIHGDVSQPAQAAALAQAAVELFGHVDTLVNNAGVYTLGRLVPPWEYTDAEWDRLLAVNLASVFYCTRAVIRGMIERQSGTIVNLTSLAAQALRPISVAPYSAAKAGVIGFTMSCAAWAAPYGVRVNAVAPGMIDTDVHRDLSPEQLRELERGVPLGRLGTPEETAEAILFLASDASRYITGTVLDVNGGLHMG